MNSKNTIKMKQIDGPDQQTTIASKQPQLDSTTPNIKVGISSCLLGQNVRFNGEIGRAHV